MPSGPLVTKPRSWVTRSSSSSSRISSSSISSSARRTESGPGGMLGGGRESRRSKPGITSSTLSGSMSTELSRSLNEGRTADAVFDDGGTMLAVTSSSEKPRASGSSSSTSSSGADANGRRGPVCSMLWYCGAGSANPVGCSIAEGRWEGEWTRAPGGGRNLPPGPFTGRCGTGGGMLGPRGGRELVPAGAMLSDSSTSISISRLPDEDEDAGGRRLGGLLGGLLGDGEDRFHIASAMLRAAARNSLPRAASPAARAASAARLTQTIASACPPCFSCASAACTAQRTSSLSSSRATSAWEGPRVIGSWLS